MRLTVRVDVHSRAKEVAARGEGFAAEFARLYAEEVQKVAKRNVAPGHGPGMHPHRIGSEHIDTGALMDSIKIAPQHRGFIEAYRIFSDVPYAAHLELGWVSKAGNRWRYSFLLPAVEEVKHQADQIARTSAKRWLSEAGAPYRGRVNVMAPLSSTFFPEEP